MLPNDGFPTEVLEPQADATYTSFTSDKEDGPGVSQREIVPSSAQGNSSSSLSRSRLSLSQVIRGAEPSLRFRGRNYGGKSGSRDPLLSDSKLEAMLEADRTRARSTLLDLPPEIRLLVY